MKFIFDIYIHIDEPFKWYLNLKALENIQDGCYESKVYHFNGVSQKCGIKRVDVDKWGFSTARRSLLIIMEFKYAHGRILDLR